MFPDHREVTLCKRQSYGTQQHTLLGSPELYDLGLTPVWLSGAFCRVRANYCGMGMLVDRAHPYPCCMWGPSDREAVSWQWTELSLGILATWLGLSQSWCQSDGEWGQVPLRLSVARGPWSIWLQGLGNLRIRVTARRWGWILGDPVSCVSPPVGRARF